jgi:glucosamine--fructose-6-phosphate aminotransferase (isomerizing)
MSHQLSILEGSYLRDLLAQPQAVADTLAGLRSLSPLPARALECERVVLTGMGSSLHAQTPLLLRLVRAGRTALLVETAELIHAQSALLDARTLVVAVSQSGCSAETVQLLDLIGARDSRPFVIGVTNTPDSPLNRLSDAVVSLCAGPEFSVSCKTYLSTLVALEWLGGAICGDDLTGIIAELDQAAPAVEGYLAKWRTHVEQLADQCARLRHLFLLGRGASLAAVGTGALILKESTRFHAEGMSSPAFRHGPLEMVSPGLFAVVFSGIPLPPCLTICSPAISVPLAVAPRLVGADSDVSAFRLPATATRLLPILEMLPVQMLSLALAVLAGREPGRFKRATKVTVVA